VRTDTTNGVVVVPELAKLPVTTGSSGAARLAELPRFPAAR